jgi:hypothetical protein
VTYLNKGQTYNLTVTDTQPPIKSDRSLEYRTCVRVSFEEEEQRSNPVGSWQLWKEGRGLKEAYDRKSELLAVEYVDPISDGARGQGHPNIQLINASVDGFCVTWRAHPTTQVCEYTIPLRFNFLSTDFSRSKGVKGVPVRLCAKTEILPSDDEKPIMKHSSEMCYCVVKLFRDHGAERKLSNDVAHVKKNIEKLNKEIADRELGADFAGPNAGYNPMNSAQFDHRRQKRKWSMKSRKNHTTDKDLHAELAQMHEVLSSARQMSVLRSRGNERDDPDLHPVILSHMENTVTKTGCKNSQQMGSTPTTSAFENSVRPLKKIYLQSSHLESPVSPQSPHGIRNVSIGALQGSSLPAIQSLKAGSYHYESIFLHIILTFSQLHAFMCSSKKVERCSRATIMQFTWRTAPLLISKKSLRTRCRLTQVLSPVSSGKIAKA